MVALVDEFRVEGEGYSRAVVVVFGLGGTIEIVGTNKEGFGLTIWSSMWFGLNLSCSWYDAIQ